MKESKKWKEVFKDILGYENNGHVQLFCTNGFKQHQWINSSFVNCNLIKKAMPKNAQSIA